MNVHQTLEHTVEVLRIAAAREWNAEAFALTAQAFNRVDLTVMPEQAKRLNLLEGAHGVRAVTVMPNCGDALEIWTAQFWIIPV